MRVLSISTIFPTPSRPGFGLFVARQAEAVALQRDVDLVMVAPLAIAPRPFHRLFHSVADMAVPSVSTYGDLMVHHPRYPYVPRIGWRLNHRLIARAVLPLARRLHAEMPFDLIDAQFFFSDGPAAAIVADALGLPLTIKARGSDIHHWGERTLSRRLMLKAAQRASGLLAVSAALKRDMAALGMADSKIAVHYTGLDHGLFRPHARAAARQSLAETLGIPIDGPLLVTVGNLIRLKGQHLAIQALSELPGARLALAGAGPEATALQALAANLGLSARVHMLGSVKPAGLPLLLSAADVMVLPSEREGLANAWIEALACGTPLVISDTGGAREVVSSASAGRLAERSGSAIAAAVRDLLAAPPARELVTANAARFDWARNAAELSAFWRQTARSSG